MGLDPWVDWGADMPPPLLFEVEGMSCVVPPPLLFRVEIKLVTTRCQILGLEFTKFDIDFAARSRWRSLLRAPDRPAGFKGTRIQGRGREGSESGMEGTRGSGISRATIQSP